MELWKIIISLITAIIGLMSPVVKLFVRSQKQLFLTTDWNQVGVPPGASLRDGPLHTLGTLHVGLLNAGSEAIEKPKLRILLNEGADLIPKPLSYYGPKIDKIEQQPWFAKGKTDHTVTLNHINPENVWESDFDCVNNGADAPEVDVNELNVIVVRKSQDQFNRLKQLNYANSKMLAEPGP